MSSHKDFLEFILEQLSALRGISFRSMMGEYMLYLDGLLFGGIYDDRLLVKVVDSNASYDMSTVIPYPNAKPMYYVEDVDNQDYLCQLVLDTCFGLKNKK